MEQQQEAILRRLDLHEQLLQANYDILYELNENIKKLQESHKRKRSVSELQNDSNSDIAITVEEQEQEEEEFSLDEEIYVSPLPVKESSSTVTLVPMKKRKRKLDETMTRKRMPKEFQHIREELSSNETANRLLENIKSQWSFPKPLSNALVNYLKQFAIPGKHLNLDELSVYLSKCRFVGKKPQSCSEEVLRQCESIKNFLEKNNIGIRVFYIKFCKWRNDFD